MVNFDGFNGDRFLPQSIQRYSVIETGSTEIDVVVSDFCLDGHGSQEIDILLNILDMAVFPKNILVQPVYPIRQRQNKLLLVKTIQRSLFGKGFQNAENSLVVLSVAAFCQVDVEVGLQHFEIHYRILSERPEVVVAA